MEETTDIVVPEDHPIRFNDRYGPAGRWLRRWTLLETGLPACVESALDVTTASEAQIDQVLSANALVRQALEVQEPAPFVEPVPTSVSRFQARAALALANLLPQVDAAINASGNPIAQLAWADAQVFERNSPTIAAMAASLNLNGEQIDALFRQAAKIVA